MQSLPMQQGTVSPITQVSYQRVPKIRQMHSDLMGAAGFQPDTQFGQPGFMALSAVMGNRPLAVGVNLP